MPSRTYLLARLDQSRVPSLWHFVLRAFLGTTNPSDARLALLGLRFPTLFPQSSPDKAASSGLSCFASRFRNVPPPHTPERSSPTLRSHGTVCGLRRDMSGSALSITFRLRI